MTRVMVFGTFDLLHAGHLYLFREAKKLGSQLIVVVARDSTVEKVKGKPPINDELERLAKVREQEYVGEAILGDDFDYYRIIEEKMPDVICLGYDQKSFIAEGLMEELEKRKIPAKVLVLPAYMPDIYKSSKIRKGR